MTTQEQIGFLDELIRDAKAKMAKAIETGENTLEFLRAKRADLTARAPLELPESSGNHRENGQASLPDSIEGVLGERTMAPKQVTAKLLEQGYETKAKTGISTQVASTLHRSSRFERTKPGRYRVKRKGA